MCSILFKIQCALLLFLSFRETNAQCSSTPHVTVTGRFLCRGLPMTGVRIELLHSIGFMNNSIGSSRAGGDGSFKVEGKPLFEPNGASPSLWLHLDYFTRTDKMRFDMGSNDFVQLTKVNANINIADVELDSGECGAYIAFHDAAMDYYNRVGERNPKLFYIRSVEDAPIATPYVRNTLVLFARGYNWSMEVAQHELAHVIRHVYDGNFTHFEKDAERYGSANFTTHDCDTNSNEGFAFNEGWALYWQGACLHSDAKGAHTIEGNVAAALRKLQATCGSSDAQMWDVLRENKNAIHSFAEYQSHHALLFDGCS